MLWVLATTALFLAVFFAAGWWRAHKSVSKLAESIRKKERLTLSAATQFPTSTRADAGITTKIED